MKLVLDALRALTVDGVSPTYAEIAVHIGMLPTSKGHVHGQVVKLEEMGKVRVNRDTCRSITVIDAAPSRQEMERWSDQEVRRAALALHEISRERGLGRVMVSA